MHATIHVFTYKAGLLARVAHDLRLTVQQYELTIQSYHVRAACAAASLTVDGVMTSHGLDTTVLSDKDQRQILETVRSEILRSDRYPLVEFEGELQERSSSAFEARGTLRLRGQARPLVAQLSHDGERMQSSFELRPSEFGIAPYKALAGAIKLEDRVRVSIDVALEGHSPRTLLEGSQPLQLTAAAS